MTDTVPVTQADCELGAAICELLGLGPCQHILDGLEDDVGVVPMVARHRLAAEQSRASTPAVDREAIARIIIGPRNAVPDDSPNTLATLQDIRWKRASVQDRAHALWCADAILALPPPVIGKLDRLEKALKRMVYEATHLSPCKPNGDHDCTIKADALAEARAILALHPPVMGEVEKALRNAREWIASLTVTDMNEIVADGGITAGMVVGQEASEQIRRIDRVFATLSTEQVR